MCDFKYMIDKSVLESMTNEELRELKHKKEDEIYSIKKEEDKRKYAGYLSYIGKYFKHESYFQIVRIKKLDFKNYDFICDLIYYYFNGNGEYIVEMNINDKISIFRFVNEYHEIPKEDFNEIFSNISKSTHIMLEEFGGI